MRRVYDGIRPQYAGDLFKSRCCSEDNGDFSGKPHTNSRRPVSSRLLGSRISMRYQLQAQLVHHFGLGPLQRVFTCTSELDPYHQAMIPDPQRWD